MTLPSDTLRTCPRLGPLTDNGGPTFTHALLHASPAIDAGNNSFGQNDDQRGTGFPRVSGANADIGAYEWQGTPDDRVFVGGFEPVCDH